MAPPRADRPGDDLSHQAEVVQTTIDDFLAAAQQGLRLTRQELADFERTVAAELRALEVGIRSYVRRGISEIIDLALDQLAGELNADLTRAQSDELRAAERTLARATERDLLRATRRTALTTKRTIRRIAAETIGPQSATTPASTLGRNVAALLRDEGIYAVRYRNGARHTIAEYARMVTRTTTAIAYNEGTALGAKAAGIGWLEVADGPDCGWLRHDSPEKANGRVVTIDEARQHPISHPNCRRAFLPRVDITTSDEARRANGRSTIPQRRLDAARAADAQRDQRAAERRKRVEKARRRAAALRRRAERVEGRASRPARARRAQ